MTSAPIHRTFPWLTRFPWRTWLLMLLVGVSLSALIPPLQSPDEADHLERAALLSQGVILLQTPPGKSSGGQIDSGLAAYLDTYKYLWHHEDRKVTSKIEGTAGILRWSGELVFRPAPGTGFYFPGIYLPQALGLTVGRILGLTIDASYRLARFLVLLTTATLLCLAFSLTTPSVFVISLLMLPMTLFQFSSATIDGLSIAVVILVLSITSRASRTRQISASALFTVSLLLFIVLTSRIQILPLIFIPTYLYFLTKGRKVLISFLTVGIATAIWTLTALHHTVDLRVTLSGTPSALAWSYLQHPSLLMNIFINTFSDSDLTTFYQQSFIGILGWLDTRFQDGFYTTLTILLFALAGLSVTLGQNRARLGLTAGLIISALLSIFLIFFLLLVTWTETGATTIQGVQGRYFILPVLMIAYAVHDDNVAIKTSFYGKLALPLLIFMGFLVASTLPRLLVERYAIT